MPASFTPDCILVVSERWDAPDRVPYVEQNETDGTAEWIAKRLMDGEFGLPKHILRIFQFSTATGATEDVTRAVAEVCKRDWQDADLALGYDEMVVAFIERTLGLVWCQYGVSEDYEVEYRIGRWASAKLPEVA